jgi:hypothetical protein
MAYVSNEINDVREQSGFKGITFSEFKKTDAKIQLLNSLLGSRIEEACYWGAEFICAGHFIDLWEIIILFYSKHIHLGNPKLAIYINLRIDNFKDIVRSGYGNHEIKLRNNTKIRKLFGELLCILCQARRRHSFDEVKIKADDFDMTLMTDRFKASDASYASQVLAKDDPKELLIAVNELAFSLSQDCRNTMMACYWFEWLVEFESICKNKKEKEKSRCERRAHIQVDAKDQMDVIWLVWDVIMTEAKKHTALLQRVIASMLNMFCLKYTNSCARKRRYLIYFAISLLNEPVELDTDIVKDRDQVNKVVNNIHKIYEQIKKNEKSPNTDYLFEKVEKTNLDKTIAKLEKMNSFGDEFVPRL